MLNTYEAWNTRKPAQSRLPGFSNKTKTDPLVAAIVSYWDNFLIYQKTQVDLLRDQNLNALECEPEYLDFLAPLHGFSGQFWDRNWPISAKRKLIDGAFKIIWKRQGSEDSIHYVLNCFDILNQVVTVNDFLVDISEVGDPIGDLAWRYNIYLPTQYENTPIEKQVQNLDYIFGVGYCEKFIIFDDTRAYSL
jgi:Phage tail protein (Tail_P2_I)